VLAAVLVALGRVGDPETARLLISFAGTDRLEVRNAARQALVLLGEAAAWQLREAFLDTTGRTAPRDWTWKRLARELFTEFDRTRLAQVYEIYEQALAAHKKGDLVAMKQGFDRVLTQSPLFECGEPNASHTTKAREHAS
jgi:HEAT repeat protein